MANKLDKYYEEFRIKTGDTLTRLRQAGFIINSKQHDNISTIEEFVQAVSGKDSLSKDRMKEQLTKIYRRYLKKEDILKLLKMGEFGLTESEVVEALCMMPLNEDGSVSVEDFVNFIFK